MLWEPFFFKEPKWKIKESFGSDEDIAEVMILYGEKGVEIWNSLEWNSLKNISSKAFSDSGWYIMRNNKDYCIISCGPNGQNGNGGHCHNDKLSFELCIKGEDIIVDPGTYVYTPLPEWRNKFRSTGYHNTVMVDNEEQNRFVENNLFSLKNDIKINVNRFTSVKNKDIFLTEVNNYSGISKELKNSLVFKREILFDKYNCKIKIKDCFKVNKIDSYDITRYFHFAPDLKLEVKKKNNKITLKNKNNVSLILDSKINKGGSLKDVYISQSYGHKILSPNLEIVGKRKSNINETFIHTIKR